MNKNQTNTQWTDARLDLLKSMWMEEGKPSCAFIAAALNAQTGSTFSRNAIISKVSREGLPKRKAVTVKRCDAHRPRSARRAKFQLSDGTYRGDGLTDLPFLIDEPPFLSRALLEVGMSECRYPRGEGLDILFCGQPAKHGSWCPFHSRIVYLKPETRPRKTFVPLRRAA